VVSSGFANIPWARRQADTQASTKGGNTVDVSAHLTGSNWRSALASSQNYFTFVRRAAYAAFHGDGAAALYVSRALAVCQLEVALYGDSSDPQAAFQAWLSAQAFMSESIAATQQRHFDLCKGFFKHDAFAALPPRTVGSYLSAKYWLGIAYADGNPVAEVMHVVTEMPSLGGGGGAQGSQMATKAQDQLVRAIETGDPEAVFWAGHFLADGHGSSDMQAYAVAIAGCDLGYDCSGDNQLIFGECAPGMAQCDAGSNFSDVVTKAIGTSGYAEAYAMAQQLEGAIAQGDVATIQKFVQLQH
jgi:hypothetical protein